MKIEEIITKQKLAFQDGVTRSFEARKSNLEKLRALVSENEDALCNAMNRDFGRPLFESYVTDINTVLQEIDFHLKNLQDWMEPEPVATPMISFPSKSVMYKQPFGAVLVISAWNYPVYLSFMPLIGAISAGNTVVLKPSEMVPETSGLMNVLVQKYFDDEVLCVVEGGVDETTELLHQLFDKIFFTGSTRVGKIVMKAAAEQLIPVLLELGGKSPAIVHHDADIDVSAKRIWWGKTINAGQTCVAPDFVAVHESVHDEFIEKSRKILAEFYRDDYKPGENYAKILNESHFERLQGLLDQSEILFGGITRKENLFIEPTIIKANWDDEIMKEEIFGPLLPVLTYSGSDSLIEMLRNKPSPLALYLFTKDPEFEERIIHEVPFGGGCVNETIQHLGNLNLPFGGVGNSGMGAYHGRHSFDAFSRNQAVMKKAFWPDPEFRYPPYDEKVKTWFKRIFS
ncbi:aldehyde dehydrogenase family protein [Rhodohalobacter sp. 614A]|uniref:aldehyde dehydrogenase family protein n=1 Tax=Rhodohalobacter sp. 614A TaxID=2908649 RepID=UPI001F21D84F|nr:aldehyde dehydrogenase family protein [Rhodohalobacter sp. 614A]